MKSKEVFDYFHLLSGADYPLVDNQIWDEWFEQCNGKSFMHYDTNEEITLWQNSKYKYRMTWHFTDCPGWVQSLFAKLHVCQFLNKIVPRPDIPGLVGGWTWWSWHRNVAEWVVAYVKQHAKEVKRFRYSRCSDELIFHTILYPHLDVLNIEAHNSLRYIDWHPKRKYSHLPLVLTEQDIPDIVQTKALICRKVELPQSEGLLDWIDNYKIKYK